MQHALPIIVITIIQTVPAKMSPAFRVGGKTEEEGRPIEAMLSAKLGKLFGRRLFAEYGDGGITGHEFDQNCDQRHDCPHDEYQYAGSAQQSEEFVLHPR